MIDPNAEIELTDGNLIVQNIDSECLSYLDRKSLSSKDLNLKGHPSVLECLDSEIPTQLLVVNYEDVIQIASLSD